MEQWKRISGFLGYSVSDEGRVRNDNNGRILAVQQNKDGVCYVGLARNRVQNRRSLGGLVANAFVPRPDLRKHRDDFTEVIHLDGDNANNAAYNLRWRPHWFVSSYARQMKHGPLYKEAGPVVIIGSGANPFDSPWHAATTFGLLEADLVSSIMNRTYVFPTFQEFRFLADD